MDFTARDNEPKVDQVGLLSNYNEKRLAYTDKRWRCKVINKALEISEPGRMRKSDLLQLLKENKIPFTDSTLKRDLLSLLLEGRIVRERHSSGAYIYSRKEPLNLDEEVIGVLGIKRDSPIGDLVTRMFEKAEPLVSKIIGHAKVQGLGPYISNVKEVMEEEFENIEINIRTRGVFLKDISRDKEIGPFPSFAQISSVEVGHFFKIKPKLVYAFLLTIVRGFPIGESNFQNESSIDDRVKTPWI